ncbi:MAG: AAA family ATPase [Candidatus Gribaldobacteria bacterium]|nr:AAA family ATPase [Candidatus Gribaldobacteria bacterium]
MTQEQALEILKIGVNVFLTGEPGSGKTHTVNQYADYLREHNVAPAITASTGIAATHLNGLTIHSWAGIGIKDHLSQGDLEQIAKVAYIRKRVNNAQVLIIDEISMLEAGTFSLVNSVCQTIRQSQEPFGGLQVVVVGDFFQLPPIGKAEQAQFAFKSPAWLEANFTVCYLTEQYRQDDADFLKMLGAIRSNGFTDRHLQNLQSRVVQLDQSPKDITRIFSHNADVDKINNQELSQLSGKAESFHMFSRGQRNFVDNLKRGCLSPETLELKIDAWVMFTKNNLKEGFVNGTLGKVVGFNQDNNNYPIIKTTLGEQIEVAPMEWVVEEQGSIKARIAQVPLRLAWAITIHKSQGMSLDMAVIDLQKTFEFGQGYVALSRVRRLSGLFLLGYNQKAFLTHPQMQKQDQTFREQSREAQESLALRSKNEIIQQQNDFLRACGGTLSKQAPTKKGSTAKKEKNSTYDQTLVLINQGKSLEEIAKIRSVTKGTVVSHLENLVLNGKIDLAELEQLTDEKLLLRIPEITLVFRELDTDKLQPVFEHFEGEHTYDDLRLARLFLNFN